MSRPILLDMVDLSLDIRNGQKNISLLRNFNLTVQKGETHGLVGMSGSGKSLAMHAILGLLPPSAKVTQGSIFFDHRDLLLLHTSQMQQIRGKKIGMIFQNPMTSLNPMMKVGKQIIEGILHHEKISFSSAFKRSIDLLKEVGIPDPETRWHMYPFQFSGGMRQRVMIAIAIACQPELVIADEPTTALDVTTQAQIIELFAHLKQMYNLTLLLITHDHILASEICDRIATLHEGQIHATN